MSSTIPYDPSLVLGNIVPQAKLDNVVKMVAIQAPADAAEGEMNSLISLKRSIDMTIHERIDISIDTSDLIQESQQVGKQLQAAAIKYGKAKVVAEKALQPLKWKIVGVSEEVESPIDYNRRQLKQMPISSDSLQMNCQYFSFDDSAPSTASSGSSDSSSTASDSSADS